MAFMQDVQWQDIQRRAQATFDTVLQAVREKFDEMVHSCNARLDVAKEGKNLLDAGGEQVEKVVLAKQSSIDAAALDADLVKKVEHSIAILEATANKLRSTEDERSFAEAYEERAQAYRQVAALLQQPLPHPDMSAAEADAVKIIQVKEGCKQLGGMTIHGIQEGTQRVREVVKQATSGRVAEDKQATSGRVAEDIGAAAQG